MRFGSGSDLDLIVWGLPKGKYLEALDLVWMELTPLLGKVGPLARQAEAEVTSFRTFVRALASD